LLYTGPVLTLGYGIGASVASFQPAVEYLKIRACALPAILIQNVLGQMCIFFIPPPRGKVQIAWSSILADRLVHCGISVSPFLTWKRSENGSWRLIGRERSEGAAHRLRRRCRHQRRPRLPLHLRLGLGRRGGSSCHGRSLDLLLCARAAPTQMRRLLRHCEISRSVHTVAARPCSVSSSVPSPPASSLCSFRALICNLRCRASYSGDVRRHSRHVARSPEQGCFARRVGGKACVGRWGGVGDIGPVHRTNSWRHSGDWD
jgi:hypothetical protein